MNANRYILLLTSICAMLLGACKREQISHNPNHLLRFSADSVCFDTVFNTIGSSTQRIMVYNPNKNALRIDQVTLKGDYFHINLDGENDINHLHDIEILGGDSMFLFVRVMVDQKTPVLVVDTIHFLVNGNDQTVHLEAYGMNVNILRSPSRRIQLESMTFQSDSAYLIFDTLVVSGLTQMQAGTQIYMHSGANLYLYGGLQALGQPDAMVRIMGDRLDKLFTHVPYRVASGQWGGIYLFQTSKDKLHADSLNYVEILSGSIGLFCQAESPEHMAHVAIANSRIHNHAAYGIVLNNTNADIWNTEISNCASYCLYSMGGTHNLTHTTIASYFGWPNSDLNIHNVGRDDVAAVYINNLNKDMAPTAFSMHNCIVTGIRSNNIVVATPLPNYYPGTFVGNYLKADSLSPAFSHDNIYAQDSDRVFVNTHYKYKEYIYYNFQLDSLSPARGIGDSLWIRAPWDVDAQGNSRLNKRPDAGCYEWTSSGKKD